MQINWQTKVAVNWKVQRARKAFQLYLDLNRLPSDWCSCWVCGPLSVPCCSCVPELAKLNQYQKCHQTQTQMHINCNGAQLRWLNVRTHWQRCLCTSRGQLCSKLTCHSFLFLFLQFVWLAVVLMRLVAAFPLWQVIIDEREFTFQQCHLNIFIIISRADYLWAKLMYYWRVHIFLLPHLQQHPRILSLKEY